MLMQKRPGKKRNWGLTLFEMVAVLLLVGILVAVGGLGLTQGVQGYLLATENANISQKAQMALVRLGLELGDCRDCSFTGNACMTSPVDFRNNLGARRLAFGNGVVSLGPRNAPFILVDEVTDFCVRPVLNSTLVDLELTLNHRFSANDQVFRKRVHYQR
jgi:type II secretory pathway pseudopilin PulG